jgi:hypothetical protein
LLYGLQRKSGNLKINKMEQELVFYYTHGGVEYITPSFNLAYTRTDSQVRMAMTNTELVLEEVDEFPF